MSSITRLFRLPGAQTRARLRQAGHDLRALSDRLGALERSGADGARASPEAVAGELDTLAGRIDVTARLVDDLVRRVDDLALHLKALNKTGEWDREQTRSALAALAERSERERRLQPPPGSNR